jgi:hypothetical protein
MRARKPKAGLSSPNTPLGPEDKLIRRMTTAPVERESVTPAAREARPSSQRTLVLVAGSGRSGTSLFTGILQRLGFYVPQPEVPADETNPRGFAESQWVVDFHTRLLRRAGVEMADARPAAWAEMAHGALDEGVQGELRRWLRKQFRKNDNVVIKDPRLSWFLPLWRRSAEGLSLSPRFVTVLRHPAAVVQSKQRSYGGWHGDISRAAGWLNQSLFTERATRDGRRVFVRHEELLDDWTRTIGKVGELLDLELIRTVPAGSIVRVHEFVDKTLTRSRASWGEFELPAQLRERADEVWDLLCRLADEQASPPEVLESLDAARAAYVELYEDAEAIARSSIVSGRRTRSTSQITFKGRALRLLARAFPRRYAHKVPVRWRRRIGRMLQRSGASAR